MIWWRTAGGGGNYNGKKLQEEMESNKYRYNKQILIIEMTILIIIIVLLIYENIPNPPFLSYSLLSCCCIRHPTLSLSLFLIFVFVIASCFCISVFYCMYCTIYWSGTRNWVFPNGSKSEDIGSRWICTVPTSLGVKLVLWNNKWSVFWFKLQLCNTISTQSCISILRSDLQLFQ